MFHFPCGVKQVQNERLIVNRTDAQIVGLPVIDLRLISAERRTEVEIPRIVEVHMLAAGQGTPGYQPLHLQPTSQVGFAPGQCRSKRG